MRLSIIKHELRMRGGRGGGSAMNNEIPRGRMGPTVDIR